MENKTEIVNQLAEIRKLQERVDKLETEIRHLKYQKTDAYSHSTKVTWL